MWKIFLKELLLNIITLGIRALRKTRKNMKGENEKNGKTDPSEKS